MQFQVLSQSSDLSVSRYKFKGKAAAAVLAHTNVSFYGLDWSRCILSTAWQRSDSGMSTSRPASCQYRCVEGCWLRADRLAARQNFRFWGCARQRLHNHGEHFCKHPFSHVLSTAQPEMADLHCPGVPKIAQLDSLIATLLEVLCLDTPAAAQQHLCHGRASKPVGSLRII